jgi:hypothetical protein
MSGAQTKSVNKDERADKEMFFKNPIFSVLIQCLSNGKGKPDLIISGKDNLRAVFRGVRHLLTQGAYHVGEVNLNSIKISVDCAALKYVTYIGAQTVISETYIYQGLDKAVRPILEYLWWWNSVTPIAGFPYVEDGFFSGPSYLPSLVMMEFSGPFNGVDKKILHHYGIDDTVLERLGVEKQRRFRLGDNSFWFDFVEANELWFESPECRLVDIVKEHMLSNQERKGE